MKPIKYDDAGIYQARTREDWPELVRLRAAPWGLEKECLEAYRGYIEGGYNGAQASEMALYDWDI